MRLAPVAVAAFALFATTVPAAPGAVPAPTWRQARQAHPPAISSVDRVVAGDDDRDGDADESSTNQPADVANGSRVPPARPIAGRPAPGADLFTPGDGQHLFASRAPPSLS